MSDTFYDRVIRPHSLYRAAGRVWTPSLLEPVIRGYVDALLSGMLVAGHPMMVWETYRSRERQAALYAKGKTKLKDVGVHHYGLAADLVFDVDGEPSWRGPWSVFGGLARSYGLTWGGDWKAFVDMPHVQRIEVRDQKRLFAGEFYPSEDG